MGKKKTKPKKEAPAAAAPPDVAAMLAEQRAQHKLYGGKEGWWWIQDDPLATIASSLVQRNHCVIDEFLASDEIGYVNAEIRRARGDGLLETRGVLGGGRTGGNLAYEVCVCVCVAIALSDREAARRARACSHPSRVPALPSPPPSLFSLVPTTSSSRRRRRRVATSLAGSSPSA